MIVSSALKLMDEVVKDRYDPAQWNIYAAQGVLVITGRMIPRCVMRFWRKNCCRWCDIIAISKSPAVRTRPCGVNTNICNQRLKTLRCSISATRMTFIRYSANCFISKVQPAIANHIHKSARGYLLWLIFMTSRFDHMLCHLAFCLRLATSTSSAEISPEDNSGCIFTSDSSGS